MTSFAAAFPIQVIRSDFDQRSGVKGQCFTSKSSKKYHTLIALTNIDIEFPKLPRKRRLQTFENGICVMEKVQKLKSAISKHSHIYRSIFPPFAYFFVFPASVSRPATQARPCDSLETGLPYLGFAQASLGG
jgi:hypothetical protein